MGVKSLFDEEVTNQLHLTDEQRDNSALTMTQLRGKVVAIHFWALG